MLIEQYIQTSQDAQAERLYHDWWQDFTPVHKHARLGPLAHLSVHPEQLNWGEPHMPFIQHQELLTRLYGTPRTHTDTDHASHPLYYEGPLANHRANQLRLFQRQNIISTIEDISLRVLERAKIIKGADPHVLTGIEVDIINEAGLLDVTDRALLQLDYVTASLHPGEFTAYKQFPEESDFMHAVTLESYLQTMLNVADRPVHAISHPLRELPEDILAHIEANPAVLVPLFEKLAEKKIAFELNLADVQDYKKRQHEVDLMIEVLKLARSMNVPLIMGTDFHHFTAKYMGQHLFDGTTQTPLDPTSREAFTALAEAHRGDHIDDRDAAAAYVRSYAETTEQMLAHPDNVAALIRPFCVISRRLEQLGFQAPDFVNTNTQRFQTWLAQRNKLRT